MKNSINIQNQLRSTDYVADDALATALQLALDLGRPLLLEGEAGVGKTEVAKALAKAVETNLIRLQCYEGLDASAAIYEWNYQRQLLSIKASEHERKSSAEIEEHIFSADFLLERPLLKAIRQEKSPVLLIDEIDRADEEFEAYLLEILSDFQVTVPELGTLEAISIPHVILTSNGTRELSDALRRRCLYFYVDFPTLEREVEIISRRVPNVEANMAEEIARFVQELRKEDLEKNPGVAETLDWAAALVGLKVKSLTGDLETIQSTLICLLKTETDLRSITPEVASRLAGKAA
ncbi:MAG: MoxR family ATPase [Sneathiella sp.]|nr:MoxR family ATPase [Sneathiella sp.]